MSHPRLSKKFAPEYSFLINTVITRWFYYGTTGLFIFSILWNIFAPFQFRFDPYPAMVVTLLFVSFIQYTLQPLMLASNALQEVSADERHKEVLNSINQITENLNHTKG